MSKTWDVERHELIGIVGAIAAPASLALLRAVAMRPDLRSRKPVEIPRQSPQVEYANWVSRSAWRIIDGLGSLGRLRRLANLYPPALKAGKVPMDRSQWIDVLYSSHVLQCAASHGL